MATNLVASLQAGSQFGKSCFTNDSKYLFCCCGCIIKVFNTTNGECMHDLEGHTKPVTGIVVNPANILQIISCGEDAALIYWDYLDGVKLKQHDMHTPLYGIININTEKKSIMMVGRTSTKTYSVLQWKKNKHGSGEFSDPQTLIEACDSDDRLVSFGCMKEYVAAGFKHELAIHSMKRGSTKIVSDNDTFNKNKKIMCVACHPSEYCIAAGLENGRIILWHNFFKSCNPVTSTLHWHALPVTCLGFTPDGSHLLSGGHECVLVRWQIGRQNQRDYKPRMGAPLSDVLCSLDGNLYATRHSDNVIQLMDINLKILQVYRGLTRCHIGMAPGQTPIPAGLRFDPRSSTLVTNGLPGHLQFYSLSLNKQLFNLDIVRQNYISAENMDRPKTITEVTSTAFSRDGRWMATFERWDDGFFTPELRLKFWMYTSEAQTYSLNTTVEHPHDKTVTSMQFRPPAPSQLRVTSVPTLVTVGADLCFKLWSLVDDTDIYRENTRWNCDCVGFYRSLGALCADFSRDGSTLAVGFEHLITVWDPENNVVHTTLASSTAGKDNVINLKFGSDQCRHHLVTLTQHSLVVWDLLTLTVFWTMKMEAAVLIRDPSSDLMAVVSRAGTVSVFRPNKDEMIYTHDRLSSYEVVDAVFVPNGRHEDIVDMGWPGPSQIYFYDANQHLITLDLPIDQARQRERPQIAQTLPSTSLRAMMAEKLIRETGGQDTRTTTGRTNTEDDSFVTAVLHSNEPVATHCDRYLTRLLVKKKQGGRPSSRDKRDSDYDDSSSSDSEMETNEEKALKLEPAAPIKSCGNASVGTLKQDMDKLLSKPLDWVQWCSTLSLR